MTKPNIRIYVKLPLFKVGSTVSFAHFFIIVFMHKYMNLFFYNIVDNMYKFKITHAGKVERSNNNVKIAKNPMSFEK